MPTTPTVPDQLESTCLGRRHERVQEDHAQRWSLLIPLALARRRAASALDWQCHRSRSACRWRSPAFQAAASTSDRLTNPVTRAHTRGWMAARPARLSPDSAVRGTDFNDLGPNWDADPGARPSGLTALGRYPSGLVVNTSFGSSSRILAGRLVDESAGFVTNHAGCDPSTGRLGSLRTAWSNSV